MDTAAASQRPRTLQQDPSPFTVVIFGSPAPSCRADCSVYRALQIGTDSAGRCLYPQYGTRAECKRVVTGAQRGYVVDHINHNGLDNRRKNLRVVSQSENMLNRGGLDANNSSGFRGVFWDATKHNFIAIVEVRGKRHRLGRFIVAHEGAFAVRDFLAQVDPVAAENYPPIEIPRFVCARSGHAR
jgi:hypothetical protein